MESSRSQSQISGMDRSQYDRSNSQNSELLDQKAPKLDFDLDLSTALKSVRFWHQFATLLTGTFFGIYLVSVYKTFAGTQIDDRTLTLAGSLAAAANGFSRVVWASFMDRFGFRPVMLVMMTIQLIVAIFISPSVKSPALYVVFVSLAASIEGG